MSVIKANGAGAAGGDFYSYKINQSLRFDRASSTYLNRTAGSPSDGKKATWSWWMKKSDVVSDTSASYRTIFWAGAPNSDGFGIAFMRYGGYRYHELIVKQDNGSSGAHMFLPTNAFYRDVSGWYHFVVSYDSTDSTANDRIKIYVNGTEQTINRSGTNINPPLNHITSFQVSGKPLRIGEGRSDDDEHIGGYLAEVNFIDGTAYDASNFGETKDGIWVAKSSSGLTFGNNGFYLPFDDSSAIGDDESSNTNDFTANNLSAYDVVPDSPTNNFATMSPLLTDTNNTTFSEGNLKTVNSAASTSGSSIAVNSGKWFVEMVCTAKTASNAMIGICTVDGFDGERQLDESQNGGSGHGYVMNASKLPGGASYGATWAIDDIIGIALDLDSSQNTVTFYKNGSSQGAININNALYVFCNSNGQGSSTVTYVSNFGQDGTFAGEITAGGNSDGNGVGDFKYSVPSGYLALCTKNLPDITIGPEQSTLATDNFNTVTYTGPISASAAAGTTGAVTGVGFQPDWVWIKTRSTLNNHEAFDSVRGVATNGTKGLIPNTTAAEQANNLNGGLHSLNSDGFTVVAGTDSGGRSNETGASDRTYASWNWKAGGSASSNSGGSITSSVSANTAAGFSIVSYTGNGTNGATFGHGLSSKPQFAIIKNREATTNWIVYVETLGATKNLVLEETGAAVTSATRFNNTEPTSTLFSLGTTTAVNGSSTDYIAYIFHSVEGYSRVADYTGNGNADGPFVFTGFRPSWVLIKSSSNGYDWVLDDTARSPFNEMNNTLFPNANYAEYTGSAYGIDFLSNGFKPRTAYGQYNLNGANYVYLAFAESPFKFANAR